MPRILVIEDDAGVREVIRRIVAGAGYASVEAPDGREGVRALGEGAFALVITDMVMPRQEGLETIRQIRGIDPQIPILAISAVFDTDYAPLEWAKRGGADLTLGKPFTAEELLEAIDKALSSRGGSQPAG